MGHPPDEALLEVDFTAHGRLGDGGNLLAGPRLRRQDVDDLGLDEGRIHVEGDQPARVAVYVVDVEGDVDPGLLGDAQQPAAQAVRVLEGSGNAELDAGHGGGAGVDERDPPREPGDDVDVEAVFGHSGGDLRDLAGVDLAAEQGDDAALLALLVDPLLVALLVDRRELGGDAELVGREKHLLEDRGGLVLVRNFDQDAEGQKVVNHRLAHVEDGDVVFGQGLGQAGGQARLVFAGDVDQNDFAHGEWVQGFKGSRVQGIKGSSETAQPHKRVGCE